MQSDSHRLLMAHTRHCRLRLIRLTMTRGVGTRRRHLTTQGSCATSSTSGTDMQQRKQKSHTRWQQDYDTTTAGVWASCIAACSSAVAEMHSSDNASLVVLEVLLCQCC
jgi:hypothetical protein